MPHRARALLDITFPCSLYATTVFSNSSHSSSSRATPSSATGCSTMPQDVGTGADTNASERGMENKGWKIKMLYDGECPLCMREVNMLRERNKSHGDAIKFVDICADDYAAEENRQIDLETAMGRIHAIQQDGEVLTNIAWASILDAIYEFWAKYLFWALLFPSQARSQEDHPWRKCSRSGDKVRWKVGRAALTRGGADCTNCVKAVMVVNATA